MSKERLSPGEIEQANRSYLDTIVAIETTCWRFSLDHRFVGGTLTDLLNTRTTAQIDFEGRRILLHNYTKPQMFRSDGTVKDVDLICFTPDRDTFYEAKNALKEQERKALKEKKPFPEVSLEPTLYPHWPPRKPLFQLVSGLEEDLHGKLYLTFDYLRQQIDPATLQRWTVVLPQNDNAWFTTLNPYAHILRYGMRNASGVKKKDKEPNVDNNGQRFNKISLMASLARQMREEALAHGINYQELYQPWTEFIEVMKKDNTVPVWVKRGLTGKWWDTVGTAVAHGRGAFKPLARFGDKFTG